MLREKSGCRKKKDKRGNWKTNLKSKKEDQMKDKGMKEKQMTMHWWNREFYTSGKL